MNRLSRREWAAAVLGLGLSGLSGCAAMRRNAPSPDLRPCTDEFVETADGWRLGVRRYRPEHPDPGKLPVILCHGLGLNATFWTITDDHLPSQLAAHGYEVFLFDLRGSGENSRLGSCERFNRFLRETPLRERGESNWTVDDVVRHDMPAILAHVERATGRRQVNWIGHSLGGMVMFPFQQLSPEPYRIANFVGMGSTIIQATTPQKPMIQANAGIRLLLNVASAGRLGRPLTYFRMPGMDKIDRFYYTAENVDSRTVSRFYGYTLEDPGSGALRQFAPYLRFGHLLSADQRIDYVDHLPEVVVPTLMVAGETDLISDVPSTRMTFDRLGSPDKTLLIFGESEGSLGRYGHCDLVWSKYAPREIFPEVIRWLDERQPVPRPSSQSHASPQAVAAG
ncbi:alpha/beta fold hydrolase [Planctomyces sp. SH-PL62]|uniref:alpha/beta fold hydrolase n=1 Tax=Planctomyces sp. SH-PL62 TaxID=1636152 RepID=UPI00078C7218|nr:alpha/beta fold hydrolase [Planctomyces sp. SH-PL62]AMV38805.1 Alpha/beta hydrolase family protein [Planctomyces sp. SH-PL62]